MMIFGDKEIKINKYFRLKININKKLILMYILKKFLNTCTFCTKWHPFKNIALAVSKVHGNSSTVRS